MHLDTSRFGVVNRAVFPEGEIEVCAEFAVRSRQQIQIEFRGHACASL